METVKIVHISDVHLGSKVDFLDSGSARIRKSEALSTFVRAVSICNDEKADFLLISGDLFDNNSPDKLVVSTVFKAFESIPQTAIFIALGNHDFLATDSFFGLDVPKNVHIFPSEWECVSVESKVNVNVFGISFDRSHITESLVRVFPRGIPENCINIMVVHGDLMKNEEGESFYNPISEEQLAKTGMNYVALGHRHKRTAIKMAGNTYFAYSGCPEGVSFDDLGEKGIYIGEISEEKTRLKFLPIAKRQFVELSIDVSECQITSDICMLIINEAGEKYGSSYGENIYRVILEGKTDMYIDVAHLKTIMQDKLFYCDIKNNVMSNVDIKLLARENTIKGIFAKHMTKYLEKNGASDEFNKAVTIGLKALEGEAFSSEN